MIRSTIVTDPKRYCVRKEQAVKRKVKNAVRIECPNTIFHLYVKSESEMAKLEIFMGNIRFMEKLGLTDIYNWCNRQRIEYDTKFNYHKEFTLWNTIRDYVRYSRQKMKYQLGFSFA